MQELVTWSALATALGALGWVVKISLSIAGKINKAESASSIAAVALTKVDLVSMQLAEYKVSAAGMFASSGDLADAERRFASAVDSMVGRFDRMTERLDRVLETIVDRRPPHNRT